VDRRCILLLIDVEPDARRPERGSPGGWDGTRAALPMIEDMRRVLAERTAVPAVLNWFLRIDPQIEGTWGHADHVLRAVPELLDTIAARGDYAGIHTHLWRWNPQARDWCNDLQDEAWMRHCLDTAIAGYEAALGRQPEACRFGDRWHSNASVRAMQQRGIRYDLSVEPGRPEERPPGDRRASGMLPDTRALPRTPFQPAIGADDSHQAPWIVPLTTSAPRWQPAWYPPFLVKASVSPNLALSPLLVAPHLEHELARVTDEPLVVVIRSGDLGSRRRLANFHRNVARIVAHDGLARCELTSPPIAVRRWLDRSAA
jgi:hypothetical protein